MLLKRAALEKCGFGSEISFKKKNIWERWIKKYRKISIMGNIGDFGNFSVALVNNFPKNHNL